MSINEFIFKIKRKIKHILSYYLFQYPRILKYKYLSTSKIIAGNPKINQPVILNGGEDCV